MMGSGTGARDDTLRLLMLPPREGGSSMQNASETPNASPSRPDCDAAGERLAGALGVVLPKAEGGSPPPGAAATPASGGEAQTGSRWGRGGVDCAEGYRRILATTPSLPEGEPGTDYFAALLRALRSEPMERRSALALVAAEGLTADQAGQVLGQDGAEVRRLADAARDAVLAGTRSGGARILIAEDERIAAFELREVLRGFGHRVVAVASTPEEAVSRANSDRPDLALVDVRLRGGSDGIGAMRAMRAATGTPAIIVTAFGDQRARAGGAEPEDGCYGFLQKPWGPAELRAAIADALIRIAAERAADRLSTTPDAA